MASRKRADAVLGYLRDRGVADEALARVHAPAGLDLGHVATDEIAVAILAEIVQLRAAGDARCPRGRRGRVRHEEVDPVCGMTVDVADARYRRSTRSHVLLLLGRLPRDVRVRSPPASRAVAYLVTARPSLGCRHADRERVHRRAPLDDLWAYLLDVEKHRPLHARRRADRDVDDQNWKGKVNAKFGPVPLSFAGTVQMTERDDDAHRAVLHAKGMEAKGKGAANATVTSWLEPAPDGETTVKMTADITLTGAAAQLSRGLLPEISKKLTQQFADCLEAAMNAERARPRPAAPDTGWRPPPRRSPGAGRGEARGRHRARPVGDLGHDQELLPPAVRGREAQP